MRFTKIYLTVMMVILTLAACSPLPGLTRASKFELKDACITIHGDNPNLVIEGSIWYEEDYILRQGRPGLHWVGTTLQEEGTLPVNPIQMVVSPDGKKAVLDGYELGASVLDSQIYFIEKHTSRPTGLAWDLNLPVLTDDNKLIGTTCDFHENRVSVVAINLETGGSRIQYDYFDSEMFCEPKPRAARNGMLVYSWYRNFEGPRLVVYDTRTEREIARYKDISYEIRPSYLGFLLNSEGTRILSISSLSGEGYDGMQQELFGVEIGKRPVQITDFHATYPYFLIYNLRFGGQRWSPDNRWVVIDAIPSESRVTDSTTATDYIFLVDLENRIAYPFCEPVTGDDYVAWSPDSRYFALSIGDKLWVVNPKTRESRLLIERPGIPLQVLGWTIP